MRDGEGEQCLRLVTPIENAGVPDKAAEGPRYAVTLAPLFGDWWEAARRYRAFALRQPRCAKGPIRERPDFPRRACEVPLWINLHGSPDDIRRLLLRAKELFRSSPPASTGISGSIPAMTSTIRSTSPRSRGRRRPSRTASPPDRSRCPAPTAVSGAPTRWATLPPSRSP